MNISKIKCVLNIISNSIHTSGVITGYIMLKNQGLIDLEIKKIDNLDKYPHNHMVEVIINDSIKVAYDLLDGYNWDEKKIEIYLNQCNFYFKRSFNKKYHEHITNRNKIYPLGLNYHVSIESNPIDILDFKTKFKSIIKYLIKKDSVTNISDFYVEKYEDIPKKVNSTPKILFYTRVWSPFGEKGEDLTGNTFLVNERNEINKMRVEIIKNLKKEFGTNFSGGLVPTNYAIENYKDCILTVKDTNKINYLDKVKNADICIANMGLHKSTGWKFAEYVASSKAIVSENLYYDVPNNFIEGKNYLSFSNSDECLNKVLELTKDFNKIFKMKNENYNYYLNHLRPDKQVLDTLNIIFK